VGGLGECNSLVIGTTQQRRKQELPVGRGIMRRCQFTHCLINSTRINLKLFDILLKIPFEILCEMPIERSISSEEGAAKVAIQVSKQVSKQAPSSCLHTQGCLN
jgi:hypothetical protein